MAALAALAGANLARAVPTAAEIETVRKLEGQGVLQHCDPQVRAQNFLMIFFCGDKLFETEFVAADGIGANVGDGQRFTRFPRADLNGPGEWARHVPPRATGPNSTSCINCHNRPADGAGENVSNNVRDPLRTRDPSRFITRNPPTTSATGVVQLLAEEINTDLQQILTRAQSTAQTAQQTVMVPLISKGIDFGSLTITSGEVGMRTRGVDADLIPKPFDWSGTVPTVRAFIRDAFHNELGLNPVETAGDAQDGDGDGVVNEVTIEDVTAMAVYQAAQQAPTTRTALSQFRQQLMGMGAQGQALASSLRLPTVTAAELQTVNRGSAAFARIGCADCHRLELPLRGRIFSEPSQNPAFRETRFPAGQDPLARGVDPKRPIRFDVTSGPPDNVFMVNGRVVAFLDAVRANADGTTTVRLLGDLRFHDMGPRLAENINAGGRGNAVFLTENLWGLATSAPYLHDGRATTITEATLEHGGEAQASRDAFAALAQTDQQDILTFLKNGVIITREGFQEDAAEGGDDDDSEAADDDD
jgi:cytochrome c peroxidase